MKEPKDIYILVACEESQAIAEQWGDYLLKGE